MRFDTGQPTKISSAWPTLMLSAGVHPTIASEQLGHSTVGTTFDLYSLTVEAVDADAAERMAGAMEVSSV